MKNLHNIIGGERNFVFSGGDIFCGEKNFGERNVLFLEAPIGNNYENRKPEQLNKKIKELDKGIDKKDAVNIKKELEGLKKELLNKVKNKDKVKNIKETEKNIEILEKINEQKEKIEISRKNLINNTLSEIYVERSKTASDKSIDGFKNFLISLKGNNNAVNETYDLKLDSDFKLEGIKTQYGNTMFDLFKRLNEFIDKDIKTSIKTVDLKYIEGRGELKIEQREGILNKEDGLTYNAIKAFKNVDFGNLFQSEGGIIAAGLGLAALRKTGGKEAFFSIVGSIAGIFGFNKITHGGLLDFLGEGKRQAIEQIKSTDYEKNMYEKLQLTTDQKIAFKKINHLRGSEFKSELKNNLSKIKLAAEGKNENEGLFKNKPKNISNQDYAVTILKIIASEGGYKFNENEGIQGIISQKNDVFLKNGLKKINAIPKNDFVWQHLNLDFQETFGFAAAKEFIADLTIETYNKMDTGLKYLLMQKHDEIKQIWGNSVVFKYNPENGNFQIFSSKENKGSKSLIVEIVKGTGRMIVGGIEFGFIGSGLDSVLNNGDFYKKVVNLNYAINNIKGIEQIGNMDNANGEQDKIKELLPKIGEYIKNNDIEKDKISFDGKDFKLDGKIFKLNGKN